MMLLLVMLGGAVGAPVRYVTDLVVRDRLGGAFPWGTFIVNVVGSFLLGLVAAAVNRAGALGWLLSLGGTGFCGALTTFSTFGYDTVRLLEDGRWGPALGNVVLSLALGLLAVYAGWSLLA